MVDRPPGQKSSNNTLYFIVGALVIAVLIIGWFMYGGGEARTGTATTTTTEQPATPPAEPTPATPPRRAGARDAAGRAEPATPSGRPRRPRLRPPSRLRPRRLRPSPRRRRLRRRAGTGNASGHDASVAPERFSFLALGRRASGALSLPAMLRRLWNGGARASLTGDRSQSDGSYPAPSRRSNRAASRRRRRGMDPYPTYRDGPVRRIGRPRRSRPMSACRARGGPTRFPILIGLAVFALIIVIRIVWGGINITGPTTP